MAGDTARLNKILLACSRGAVRLFRNSVGVGWVGTSWRCPKDGMSVTLSAGDVVVRKARPLHAGLLKGSGDLIGWVEREIGPEHVGQKWAVFASIEDKGPRDKSSPDQVNWRERVREAGGLAAEVRSVEGARRALLQE